MSILKTTIKYCLNFGVKKLLIKKLLRNSAYLDSELLLSYTLKKPKEYILTHSEKLVSKAQRDLFFQYIKRRIAYEPIAYIVGRKEFYGREFFVNKNVLIPRPETEMLVEEVIKYCYELRAESSGQNLQSAKLIAQSSKLTIADIGTGSGCIAITLAKEFEIPLTRLTTTTSPSIYATDISSKALAVAKKNAKMHNAKISFYKGNLLEPLKNKKIDIIIANLPYLDPKEKNIYKKILRFEPYQSLYAKNGLEFYKKFFLQMLVYEMYPRYLVLEIPPKHKNKIKKIASPVLHIYDVTFRSTVMKLTKFIAKTTLRI